MLSPSRLQKGKPNKLECDCGAPITKIAKLVTYLNGEQLVLMLCTNHLCYWCASGAFAFVPNPSKQTLMMCAMTDVETEMWYCLPHKLHDLIYFEDPFDSGSHMSSDAQT